MITESQQPVPVVFGRDGEPCPACGAPLAGDQRYCLHCGVRRPQARLEFLDVLDADVHARSAPPLTPLVPVPAAGPPSGLNARLQANAGLLALAALLLLTLIAGLLIGHWATGRREAPSAAAPAPQVITVAGAAAPAAASTEAAGGSGATGATNDGGSPAGKGAKAKAKDAASSQKATVPKGAVSVKDLSSKKAVDEAVKKGKPISTGTGKLPPKDDKPAAGGAGFEEIG